MARNPRAGSDDQGSIRAGKCSAESLNRTSVDLTVLFEFREVVDEGGVNHAVTGACSLSQALQVFDITSMHLRTSGDQRLGASF